MAQENDNEDHISVHLDMYRTIGSKEKIVYIIDPIRDTVLHEPYGVHNLISMVMKL